MIIGVDFDGTIVEHKYPYIGRSVPDAIAYLRDFVKLGAKLILWTMRSGETLDEAVEYCEENGVSFWGVNSNPEQHSWTSSPKQYCHLYIDDAAFGCPLIPGKFGPRQMVDWSIVGPAVMENLHIDEVTR